MDWCRNVDYGSLPDWLAGFATVGAFWIAAIAFAKGIEDRRVSQPRLVHPFSLDDSGSPWIGGAFEVKNLAVGRTAARSAERPTYLDESWVTAKQLGATTEWNAATPLFYCVSHVTNASTEVITDVEAGLLIDGRPWGRTKTFQHVRPGEQRAFRLWATVPNGREEVASKDVIPYVRFTDAAGHRWFRALDAPLKRLTRRSSKPVT